VRCVLREDYLLRAAQQLEAKIAAAELVRVQEQSWMSECLERAAALLIRTCVYGQLQWRGQ
jgi:hypothetical protein